MKKGGNCQGEETNISSAPAKIRSAPKKAVRQNKIEENARQVIESGLRLISDRFSGAVDYQQEIFKLMKAISESDKEEIEQKKKSELIELLQGLRVQKVEEVAKVITAVCDKLKDGAEEESGVNISISLES